MAFSCIWVRPGLVPKKKFGFTYHIECLDTCMEY
jgi:hypothetical protein